MIDVEGKNAGRHCDEDAEEHLEARERGHVAVLREYSKSIGDV